MQLESNMTLAEDETLTAPYDTDQCKFTVWMRGERDGGIAIRLVNRDQGSVRGREAVDLHSATVDEAKQLLLQMLNEKLGSAAIDQDTFDSLRWMRSDRFHNVTQ